MNTAILIWGLWVVSGGPVNSGGLYKVELAATFSTLAGCEFTKQQLTPIYSSEGNRNRTMKCIQADYFQPAHGWGK